MEKKQTNKKKSQLPSGFSLSKSFPPRRVSQINLKKNSPTKSVLLLWCHISLQKLQRPKFDESYILPAEASAQPFLKKKYLWSRLVVAVGVCCHEGKEPGKEEVKGQEQKESSECVNILALYWTR